MAYIDDVFDEWGAWHRSPSPVAHSREEKRRLEAARMAEKLAFDREGAAARLSRAGYPIDDKMRKIVNGAASGVNYTPHLHMAALSFARPKLGKHVSRLVPLPERDHAFQSTDFLPFSAAHITEDVAIERLRDLPEGVIHNFSVANDVHDTALIGESGRHYVLSGLSVIRHGKDIGWLALGGVVLDDFDAVVAERRACDKRDRFKEGVARVRPLEGTTDVLEVYCTGCMALDSREQTHRTITIDWGGYHERALLDELDGDAREPVVGPDAELFSALKSHEEFLRLFRTALYLPAYFQARVDVMYEMEVATEFGRPTPKTSVFELAAAKHAKETEPQRFRKVAALRVSGLDISRAGDRHVYTPPEFRVDVDGFFRQLRRPESIGKDQDGKPIVGRTWVKPHDRYKDKPPREAVILVKAPMMTALDLARDAEVEDDASFDLKI